MDLLAIIKDRINEIITTTIGCVACGTGHEPADTRDASEIEATDVLIESASCTSDHDTYDAFSEPVMNAARNSPHFAIKNECVMPENNQEESPARWRQMGSRSEVKAEWPPEVQSLVDWFLAFDPPKESFYLVPHLLINNPMKFFQSLRLGIETGPKGPRARRGALQWDLRQLKAYFSEERSPEA
jgi:hypothetical protein